MKTLAPTNTFSIARLTHLIRRTISLNIHTWSIGFASVAGLLVIIWFLPFLFNAPEWHQNQLGSLLSVFLFFYMVGGLILTSSLFNEIHSPSTAFLNLCLPATAAEKITAAWIVSTILYTVTTVISFFLLMLVLFLISSIVLAGDYSLFLTNPFRGEIASQISTYTATHAIFLFGASFFRKNNFLKTLLLIVLFFTLLMTILGAFSLITGTAISIGIEYIPTALHYAAHVFLILLFVWLAWYHLQNRQVV
jgi:hypothetical protein